MSYGSDQKDTELVMFIMGIIGYLWIFFFGITSGISGGMKLLFLLTSGAVGYLLYEAFRSDTDWLSHILITVPGAAFFVLLLRNNMAPGSIGFLFDPGNILTARILLPVLLLAAGSGWLLRRTRLSEARGRDLDSDTTPDPEATPENHGGPYDGGYNGHYADYTRNGGAYSQGNYGEADYYEPGSQYKKDTDWQYTAGAAGAGAGYGSPPGGSTSEPLFDPRLFKDLNFSDPVLRAIMMPMGYMSARSSSGAELQIIHADEQIDRLGIPESLAAKARAFFEEGKTTSPWNINLVLRECPLIIGNRSLAAAVFYLSASSLFYDETVTSKETELFSKIADAFCLTDQDRKRIFSQLLKDYNLFFDAKENRYRAYGYGYSSGGSAKGDPGAGSQDSSSSREQERKRREQEEAEAENVTYSSKEIRNAYNTLQIKKDDDPQTIKAAYRRLIARYHPDKAVSRGLSAKEIAEYNEITQKLNQAWDIICAQMKI